eukprot:CAMPEP_0115831696 /NCGR_PEP_ID=MMETSP0287-20121206/2273_1 /TAXON_ID=412157 /ORGANISM="Chrysochromulina rotalis, Strain UIO044" /LENGTH=304 /DNA_ID=CAMNT_0003285053 /DNA_START=26 /DNA_END=942 /DNA_ORIENTATION=-
MARDALSSAGRLLVALIFSYPLVQLARDRLAPHSPSNDDSNGAVRFVHIPKTGGAAVVTHLRKQRACPAMDGGGHDVSEATALARNQVPIIVLREPHGRLQSAFEYWQRGSEVHPTRPMPQMALLHSAMRSALPNFDAFLEGFSNASSWRRPAVLQVMSTPHHLNEWVWDAHFKPQAEWVEQESERSIFAATIELISAVACSASCVDERPTLLAGCNFSSMRTVNRTPRRFQPISPKDLRGIHRRAVRATMRETSYSSSATVARAGKSAPAATCRVRLWVASHTTGIAIALASSTLHQVVAEAI